MNALVSYCQVTLNHGQDNYQYESLLVVQVPEMSGNPAQSFTIHHIIRSRKKLLAVILYIVLSRYDIDIEFCESPNGNHHFHFHVAVHSDFRE